MTNANPFQKTIVSQPFASRYSFNPMLHQPTGSWARAGKLQAGLLSTKLDPKGLGIEGADSTHEH